MFNSPGVASRARPSEAHAFETRPQVVGRNMYVNEVGRCNFLL
jgi:hypothetical protein